MITIIPYSDLRDSLPLRGLTLKRVACAAHGRFAHVEANSDVVAVSLHVGGGRHIYNLLKFRPLWPDNLEKAFSPCALPLLMNEDGWQFHLLAAAAYGDWARSGFGRLFTAEPALIEAMSGYDVRLQGSDLIELRLQALALEAGADVERHVEVGTCRPVPILQVVRKERIQIVNTETRPVNGAGEDVERVVDGHGTISPPPAGGGNNQTPDQPAA